MAHFEPRGLGWLPSRPDFRDYSPWTPPVSERLAALRDSGASRAGRASHVDLREYFVDVPDQQHLRCSSVHTCLAMVEYFHRRASGQIVRPSRLFVYHNALRLAQMTGDCGCDLRTTFQALIRCGAPPEHLWPYEPDRLADVPEPFLYSFADSYRAAMYVRLDRRNSTGETTLAIVKAMVAAGFPTAFGVPLPSAIPCDGHIPYRPTFESVRGGQALLAVGYDDRWLRGSRGALLVRGSWGTGWGDEGYGWLPYAYVEEQLAGEFWTIWHPDWIAEGDFEVPELDV